MELVLATPKQYYDNEKICYQQIYKSYWYANYGDFTTVIHKGAGYVNASLLCKTYKKRFSHWSANKNTKAMIAGLAEKVGLAAGQMLITVEGGGGNYKKHICGTYVHPILFPQVAAWLDPTFAGVVSIMANNFYGLQSKHGDLASILEDIKKEKPKAEPEVEEEKDSDDEEGSETEDVVPSKLKKSFKIFKRDDPKFPYQAIETLQAKMAAAIKRFQKTPAGTKELVLEIDGIPDVVSLFNMLKSSGLIQTHKNTFKSKFPNDVLVQKIKEVSWSNVTKQAWVEPILASDLAMSDDEE